MAAIFLTTKQYHKDKMKMVTDCIESTRFPQQPYNQLQEVLRDADFYHLAKPDMYF